MRKWKQQIATVVRKTMNVFFSDLFHWNVSTVTFFKKNKKLTKHFQSHNQSDLFDKFVIARTASSGKQAIHISLQAVALYLACLAWGCSKKNAGVFTVKCKILVTPLSFSSALFQLVKPHFIRTSLLFIRRGEKHAPCFTEYYREWYLLGLISGGPWLNTRTFGTSCNSVFVFKLWSG